MNSKKHTLSRKVLATLLTAAMLITMMPSAMFANGDSGQAIQGTVNDPITATSNGVTVNKYVTGNSEDGYNLTLEAFASDQLTTTTNTTPLDIVLVLDVSGSMDEKLGDGSLTYTATKQIQWSYSDIGKKDRYYYLAEDGNYYIVHAAKYREEGDSTKYALTYWMDAGDPESAQPISGSITGTSQSAVLYNGGLYTASEASKMDALKTAVNSFIDEVAENAENSQVDHKISIVKFAGNKSDAIGNDTYEEGGWIGWHWYSYEYNYSQIVKKLTSAGTKADELKAAVNALDPMGATQADYGMQYATKALETSDSNAKKVVVMFTDGTPTSGNSFESDVANDAISAAKSLKDANTTIYTVGVFSGANPLGQSAENKYLNGVSSNYPKATAYDSLGQRVSEDKNYYFAADDAGSLNDVFSGIAEDITTGTLEANPDSTAVLSDTLSQYFNFPSGFSEKNVTVQYAPATGYDPETKTFTFGAPEDLPQGVSAPDVEVDSNAGTITVDNFNYKQYAASYNASGNPKVTGGKLVVTFPIEVDVNACLTDTTIDNGWYPTNNTIDSRAKLSYKSGAEATTNDGYTALDQSPMVQLTDLTANGTDVTVQVYVDGEKVNNPDEYVTLTRDTDDTSYNYFKCIDNNDGVLTYDFNYNPGPESGHDCVDINVALKDTNTYLQGVKSYQSYGKSGTDNVIEKKNGTYTVDNITSDNDGQTVDCTIYLRTKYSVDYYQNDTLLDSGVYDDQNVYIESEDVSNTTDEGPAKEAGHGHHHDYARPGRHRRHVRRDHRDVRGPHLRARHRG